MLQMGPERGVGVCWTVLSLRWTVWQHAGYATSLTIQLRRPDRWYDRYPHVRRRISGKMLYPRPFYRLVGIDPTGRPLSAHVSEPTYQYAGMNSLNLNLAPWSHKVTNVRSGT